jgi:hypothetical protein
MGLLFDAQYWANVANEMYAERPVPGRSLPRDATAKFLQLPCTALNDLLKDDAFSGDLGRMTEIVRQSGGRPSVSSESFKGFLREFLRAETALLLQSGMDFDCATDIVDELRRVVHWVDRIGFNEVGNLPGHLTMLRDKVCAAATSEARTYADEVRSHSYWRVVKACAAIAADGAISLGTLLIDPLVLGPLTAEMVGGTSIGGALMMIGSARSLIERL